MPVNQIRNIIRQANEHEAKTNNLHKVVAEHLDDIHHSIAIDQDDEITALFNFAVSYIEHVPEFIEALRNNATRLGIAASIEKVVSVAEQFFIHPPQSIVEDHVGLAALLDEAYLAHRLMEELNDLFLLHHGILLIPQDMITANLIVHAMIGDPFAGDLDALVLDMVESLITELNKEDVKASLLRAKAMHDDSLLNDWPCMSRNHGIVLAAQEPA